MRLNRDDAVAMCEALGFKTAKSWNRKRMRKKLVEIAGQMAVDADGLTIEEDERLDEMLQAVLLVGGEVEVSPGEPTDLRTDTAEPAKTPPDETVEPVEAHNQPDEPPDPVDAEQTSDADPDDPAEVPEPQPAAPPKKRGRPKGSKGKAKGKKAKVEEKAGGKDQFGNRVGTKAAKICACLGKEPKLMKKLMEDAGDEVGRYNLMGSLCKKGLVVREDKGFRLP